MAQNQRVPSHLLERDFLQGEKRVVSRDGNDGAIGPDDFLDEPCTKLGMDSEARIDLVVHQCLDHLADGHFNDFYLGEGLFLSAARQQFGQVGLSKTVSQADAQPAAITFLRRKDTTLRVVYQAEYASYFIPEYFTSPGQVHT